MENEGVGQPISVLSDKGDTFCPHCKQVVTIDVARIEHVDDNGDVYDDAQCPVCGMGILFVPAGRDAVQMVIYRHDPITGWESNIREFSPDASRN